MSGLNEILEWSESVGLDTFDEIESAFEEDGRLPLREILGDDVEVFIETLDSRQQFKPRIQREETVIEPTIQLEEEDDPQEMPQNLVDRIVSSFINFFRGN